MNVYSKKKENIKYNNIWNNIKCQSISIVAVKRVVVLGHCVHLTLHVDTAVFIITVLYLVEYVLSTFPSDFVKAMIL